LRTTWCIYKPDLRKLQSLHQLREVMLNDEYEATWDLNILVVVQ